MFELAGLGLGLIGNIGKLISRGKANKKLNQLSKEDPAYAANPIAQQRLGLAQALLNARMPGSAAAERNIYSNASNQVRNIQRGATDASQALAASSGAYAQADDAFTRLGMQEAQDYQRRYSNLTDAQQGMITEGDKVYSDQVRRFGNKVQFTGAQVANNANSWGDLSNFGFSLMDFGASGGFGNLFGNNSNNNGNPNNISVVNQNQYGGWTPRRF